MFVSRVVPLNSSPKVWVHAPGTPTGIGADWVDASRAAAAGAAARPGPQGGAPPEAGMHSWVPRPAVDGVSGDAACAATAPKDAVMDRHGPRRRPGK